MKKSCKFCWGVSIVLLAVVLYGGYVFGIRGNVEKGDDGRTAVVMAPGDRIRVLGEMRAFLETLQSIDEAIASDDMKEVERLARASGMVKAGGESPAFIATLPLEFKTLGMGLHKSFDGLADLAATDPKPQEMLAAVSDVMLTCTACHASYQLKAAAR